MNNSCTYRFLIFASLWTFLSPANTPAQSFELTWSTLDAGGGTSTAIGSPGVTFSLSGTIGQPDAGHYAIKEPYSLIGGFWVFASPLELSKPTLRSLTTTSNSVIISWPSPSPGWTLQQNTSLAADSWADVTTAPMDDGVNKSIVIPLASPIRFYRLRK